MNQLKNITFIVVALLLSASVLNAQNKPVEQAYYFSKEVNGSYEEVVEKIKSSLAAEGFGVVSEMMMHKTLNEKAGASMETYAILGICNPNIAYKAIQMDENIGLFLPCKAVVRKNGTTSYQVVFQDPVVALSAVGNSEINKLAKDISKKLKRALEAM